MKKRKIKINFMHLFVTRNAPLMTTITFEMNLSTVLSNHYKYTIRYHVVTRRGIAGDEKQYD